MQTRIFVILVGVICISLLCISLTPSYGHGVGGETLPPVMIGNRNVTLSIAETQASSDSANVNKEITLQLFETNSKNPVKDVTFFVQASKDDKVLFNHEFQRDDGNLIMTIVTTKSGNVSVQDGSSLAKFLNPLLGGNFASVITGPIFGTGGLYKFHIEILTADSYNKLDSPIKYDAAISIPETTTYQIHDNDYGEQKIGVITYYDQINNFQYDSESNSIKFVMPFDWSESSINQVSIVHEEVLIPKSFGNLLVTKYAAYVNDLPLPDNTVTIDDYSAEDRIVHIALNKPELLDLAKINENSKQGMEFILKPSNENNFPITAYTRNGQYKINLSWNPPTIVSGSNTEFSFDVKDPYLLNNKTVSVNYDFAILQNDHMIFKKSGITSESPYASNVIDVIIPQNITGPITIKFENMGDNSYASAEFLAVADRAITPAPTFPVKLSSFSTQSDSKIAGKYDVDLTWFPSTIQIDQQTEFVFTIKDKNTGNAISQSSYDFVIMQKGNEVFRKSGMAAAGGDYIDYTFSNGQDGPTMLRIENINNSGELVEVPIVVTPEFPIGLVYIIMSGFLAGIVLSRKSIIHLKLYF
jgi:hypothetical protein